MLTTYKQCRNVIIDAYFKDEIQPFDANFCFCGTLCPADQIRSCGNNMVKNWNNLPSTDYSKHFFTAEEYGRMEKAMMLQLKAKFSIWQGSFYPSELYRKYFCWRRGEINESNPEWEECLFKGMSDALDEMRQIFIERGLPVDEEETLFVKRKLLAV